MKESRKPIMVAVVDVIWIIAAIGAINWGLIGLFNFNLIDRLFADRPTRILYVIIGVCGALALFLLPALKLKGTVGRRTL